MKENKTIIGKVFGQALPVVCLLFCLCSSTWAQKRDSTKIVYIENANNQITDLTDKFPRQFLNGDVRAFQDSVYMFCDTAILYNNTLTAFGNVAIVQSDTIRIFADSLYYNGDSLKAYFYENVILENGASKLYTSSLVYNVGKKYASYSDTAQLTNHKTSLVSIRGVYDLNAEIAWFYDKVKVDDEDFDLFTDSLRFDVTPQVAHFLSPTIIDQGKSQIYCEDGFYDIKNKFAEFRQNAQYKEGKTIAKADILRYNGKDDIITLDGNADYKGDKETGTAALISYNRTTGDIRLRGDGRFSNQKNTVTGDDIYYNKKTEKFKVTGRSFISDPPYLIYAENIDYDKVTGGFAEGNVIWKDTTSRINLFGDRIEHSTDPESVKAIGFNGRRPLMESYDNQDTFYLSADTLYSYEIIHASDSLRLEPDTVSYFIADNDVRIFKKDLQAVSDSLSYNRSDSIITLFQKPVIWSDTTQIFGDTIDMFIVRDQVDSLYVRPNGLIINSSDLVYFNQIKGRTITAKLDSNKIKTMYVDGNATTLYYMLDEVDAYIGVNKTECSNIVFRFNDNEISSIHFYIETNSVLYPMLQADHEGLKLPGFKWILDRRPLVPADVTRVK